VYLEDNFILIFLYIDRYRIDHNMLYIHHTIITDQGTYRCVVKQEDGKTDTADATLGVCVCVCVVCVCVCVCVLLTCTHLVTLPKSGLVIPFHDVGSYIWNEVT